MGHKELELGKETERWLLMCDQVESLWELFESSGCIVYYLLYKMLIGQ